MHIENQITVLEKRITELEKENLLLQKKLLEHNYLLQTARQISIEPYLS